MYNEYKNDILGNYFKYSFQLLYYYFLKHFYIIVLFILIGFGSVALYYKGLHKLSHKFWYNQPVNFRKDNNTSIKIIQTEPPKSTRWTNYKNISLYSLYDKELSFEDIHTFLYENYKEQQDCGFIYAPQHLDKYLKGHNYPVYIGIYKDNTAMIKTGEMIGCITAYPLNIKAKNSKLKYVYYVDNLCIKIDMRKKSIAPQLIDTLHHHFRHNNDATKVSLFKRESHLSDYIVPVVCYSTSLYHIDLWFNKPIYLHSTAKVLDITKQNINVLYNFLYNYKGLDLFIFPELSNLEELLEKHQLFIKLVMVDSNVAAAYIFRDTNTLYNKIKCIECIGSINHQKNTPFFINSFLYILRDFSDTFKILQIEKQSDNVIIDKEIRKKWSSFLTTPISWFFYNYIYPEQNARKSLILA